MAVTVEPVYALGNSQCRGRGSYLGGKQASPRRVGNPLVGHSGHSPENNKNDSKIKKAKSPPYLP
jgi:hypothetical protein